jgi:hypothetical protein
MDPLTPLPRIADTVADVASELRDIAKQLDAARITNIGRRVRSQAERLENQREPLTVHSKKERAR